MPDQRIRLSRQRRALLDELLPGERLDIRAGQFHVVALGAQRVVCFARTDAAAARLIRRAGTLQVLDELDLGFRVPQPLPGARTATCGQVPAHLVLTRVPGVPMEPHLLGDPAARDGVARGYAAALNALAAAAENPQVWARLPHTAPEHWARFAQDVRAELFGLMSVAGQRRAERELAAVQTLPHVASTVAHGDLGAENVLWLWPSEADQPQLSGIIDWDEVAVGDPAVDLAAIAASYDDDLLRRVLTLIGDTSAATEARITTIRGTFALQQALDALRDGDQDELDDGLCDYRATPAQ